MCAKNISIEHYVSYDENNKLKLSYYILSLIPITCYLPQTDQESLLTIGLIIDKSNQK